MSDHFDPAREAEAIGLPPGHTLRPATWDDVATVAALRDLANRRIDPTLGLTEEDVRREWGEPSFSPEADARLVFDGEGALVGYFYYYGDSRSNHPGLHGHIHHDAEGRGLGTAGLRWGMRRALERTAVLPLGRHISPRAYVRSTFAPGVALLQGFGMYEVHRFGQMVIELEELEIPEPQWSEGITLRPFDRERDALAVYRARQEAFGDPWASPSEEKEGFELWRHWVLGDPLFDPTLFFVASDGKQIVGLALCCAANEDDPATGWLSQLGVRPAWRKRGLGTALLYYTFREFKRRGRARVGLGVGGTHCDGATRLYERVGMRIARETAIYELELRPGYETAAL